jgi:hypothetical protein
MRLAAAMLKLRAAIARAILVEQVPLTGECIRRNY